jgi:hypothetical protein
MQIWRFALKCFLGLATPPQAIIMFTSFVEPREEMQWSAHDSSFAYRGAGSFFEQKHCFPKIICAIHWRGSFAEAARFLLVHCYLALNGK